MTTHPYKESMAPEGREVCPPVPKPKPPKKANLDTIATAVWPVLFGSWIFLPFIIGFATWNGVLGLYSSLAITFTILIGGVLLLIIVHSGSLFRSWWRAVKITWADRRRAVKTLITWSDRD